MNATQEEGSFQCVAKAKPTSTFSQPCCVHYYFSIRVVVGLVWVATCASWKRGSRQPLDLGLTSELAIVRFLRLGLAVHPQVQCSSWPLAAQAMPLSSLELVPPMSQNSGFGWQLAPTLIFSKFVRQSIHLLQNMKCAHHSCQTFWVLMWIFLPFDRKCHGYFKRKKGEGALYEFPHGATLPEWQYILILAALPATFIWELVLCHVCWLASFQLHVSWMSFSTFDNTDCHIFNVAFESAALHLSLSSENLVCLCRGSAISYIKPWGRRFLH